MAALDHVESYDTTSSLEESCLIIGVYIIGPLASGIAICLLFCILRYLLAKQAANHYSQIFSKFEYWFGILSIFFTVLLNISYSVLGTDLLVPWNDNPSIEDSYDSNTMLQFVSLCIFLWYFSKLFFYISFIYFAYSALSLPHKLKLWLKVFVVIQVSLTFISVGSLIYLNHDLYQIQVTPNHHIQLIAQLKGHFFFRDHSHSVTEIAAMIPLLTDVSALMILFKVYIQRSQQLQWECDSHTGRQYINLCVRAIMLLFMGSLTTWTLFINIFMKSPIVWIMIPYDMLFNNMCVFLLYPQSKHMYKLLCFNCHQFTFYQCFFPNFKKANHEKSVSQTIKPPHFEHIKVPKQPDAEHVPLQFGVILPAVPDVSHENNPSAAIQQLPSYSHSKSNPNVNRRNSHKASLSSPAPSQSGMVKRKDTYPQQMYLHNNVADMYATPMGLQQHAAANNNHIDSQNQHALSRSQCHVEAHLDHNNNNNSNGDSHLNAAHGAIDTMTPTAFGKFLRVEERQNAAMQFYRYNHNMAVSASMQQQPLHITTHSSKDDVIDIQANYLRAKHDQHQHQRHEQQHDKYPSGVSQTLPSVTKTKSDPSYLHRVSYNNVAQQANFQHPLYPPISQNTCSSVQNLHDEKAKNMRSQTEATGFTAASYKTRKTHGTDSINIDHSMTFSGSNIIKAIVNGAGDESKPPEDEEQDDDHHLHDGKEIDIKKLLRIHTDKHGRSGLKPLPSGKNDSDNTHNAEHEHDHEEEDEDDNDDTKTSTETSVFGSYNTTAAEQKQLIGGGPMLLAPSSYNSESAEYQGQHGSQETMIRLGTSAGTSVPAPTGATNRRNLTVRIHDTDDEDDDDDDDDEDDDDDDSTSSEADEQYVAATRAGYKVQHMNLEMTITNGGHQHDNTVIVHEHVGQARYTHSTSTQTPSASTSTGSGTRSTLNSKSSTKDAAMVPSFDNQHEIHFPFFHE